MENNAAGPSWLSTWQAICEQEAQSKIGYKKFIEEWYRIETKIKLMDLRVDAMLRVRDEYLTHLFQKYPNWKPTFTSFGLRASAQSQDRQSDLYRLMETEIMRSLRQHDSNSSSNFHQPTFTQAMADLSSGPLYPSYINVSRSHATGANYGYGPLMTSPGSTFAVAPYHTVLHESSGAMTHHQTASSEMAELKTEMTQIKSRLEDITIYLRELRHSAIELTTSVSRRSSMRDKERRRAPIIDQNGVSAIVADEIGDTRGAFVRGNTGGVVNNRPDSFADQVTKKLLQEKSGRNIQVRYQYEEDGKSDFAHNQQSSAPGLADRQVLDKKHPEKPAVVEDDDFESEREKPVAKGPRFDFNAKQRTTALAKQEPKPAEFNPRDTTVSDENTSSESESPLATASWLITAEKPKSAPATILKQSTDHVKDHSSTKNKKNDPVSWGSSPNWSPESKPKSSTGGYQALLSTVSKGEAERKDRSEQKVEEKSDESDSDDLDAALNASKSPSSTTGAAANAKEPTRPRDASLSDIFSFGKVENKTSSDSVLKSPEKPKSAPTAMSTVPVANKQEPSAAKNTVASAPEPDDFLKKLFPDKFAGNAAGQGKKGIDAAKKKPAFFMGDDSDDDIDLPQGKKKSDDLDDDFFFR